MNIESLIELFGVIRDRAELEAEFVRDLWPRLAKGEVNSDFRLRRGRAAFAQPPPMLAEYRSAVGVFGVAGGYRGVGRNKS